MASATDGRELLSSAGLSIDDDDSRIDALASVGPKSSEAVIVRTKDSPVAPGQISTNGGGGGSSGQHANQAQMRLASDRAMIACVKEDAGHHAYFSKPPLKDMTLCFTEKQVRTMLYCITFSTVPKLTVQLYMIKDCRARKVFCL